MSLERMDDLFGVTELVEKKMENENIPAAAVGHLDNPKAAATESQVEKV